MLQPEKRRPLLRPPRRSFGHRWAFAAALAVCCGALAPAHAGDSVARWVDEAGVTHFGDPRLAPPDASQVEVAPANLMDAPEVRQRTGRGRPTMIRIDSPANRNPEGWRGFDGWRKANPNRPGRH